MPQRGACATKGRAFARKRGAFIIREGAQKIAPHPISVSKAATVFAYFNCSLSIHIAHSRENVLVCAILYTIGCVYVYATLLMAITILPLFF